MWPSNSKTSSPLVACSLTLVVVFWANLAAGADGRRKTGDDCLSDPVCSGLYEEARRLSKSGELAAALVAYQTAYRRQPMPWLLINIGRTLQKLGRLQEALAHYQRYSAAEPNGPADRQQMIREYTAQAEKSLAEKPAEGTANSDKNPSDVVEPAPQPLLPDPPPVVVAPPPPQKVPLVVEPVAPPKSRGMPAYFYAGLGVGGALLVTGAITGGLALAQSRSLQETAYAGPASEALLEQQSRVRGLAAATDALLAVGGVTIGVVTIAALVQRYRHRGERSSAAAGTLRAGLGGLSGRF